MSDNDLIRRGDALYAIAGWEIPSTAIAALPAVTVGAYTRTGVMDKDGREICVGDRIMIDLSGNATKREYWRPEYEVVFKPPHFTLKHVGGDKDSDTARFQWNVPQRSSTERITTLSIATLYLTPAPDAPAEIDLRAVEMERIEEAASQSPWVPAEYSMSEVVSDCCAFLREPRQPAPDAAAIRAAAEKLAAFLDAKHQSYMAAKGRNPADYVSGYSIARDKAAAILALIPKGGDGGRVYMGQIMAECDCPREAECQAAGRCIAEERK